MNYFEFFRKNFKENLRKCLQFLIPRYPFFNVLTFLMFLGERAKITKTPPFEPILIYGFIGLMFVSTIGMSLKFIRSQFAIFSSILLTVLMYLFYENESLHYHQWLKVRICQGILGAMWTMLLYGYFAYKKPRPRWLLKGLEYVLIIIMVMEFFIFWYSGQDSDAFKYLVSSHPLSYCIYIFFICLSVLSVYNQYFTYESVFVIGILWTIKVTLINMNLHYWCVQRKVDYWLQIRIVIDGITFILGTIFYITSFIKISYSAKSK